MTVKTFLFVGKPGCGKETQGHLLAGKLGFSVLSTGEKFRELRDESTVLGRKIRDYYDNGRLLPPWLASHLFQKTLLALREEEGIVFEGTGRALPEARLFHEVAEWIERPYRTIHLRIDDDEAVKRQLGRGRSDSDTEDRIRVRFNEYNAHTMPVLDFFREKGTMIEIDGMQSKEQIHENIMAEIARLS